MSNEKGKMPVKGYIFPIVFITVLLLVYTSGEKGRYELVKPVTNEQIQFEQTQREIAEQENSKQLVEESRRVNIPGQNYSIVPPSDWITENNISWQHPRNNLRGSGANFNFVGIFGPDRTYGTYDFQGTLQEFVEWDIRDQRQNNFLL
jgi:hypothetical protein